MTTNLISPFAAAYRLIVVAMMLALPVVGSLRLEAGPWDEQYVPGPDSKPQEGVPKGETFDFTFNQSKIFPGTTRKIWVYVPWQYTGETPACVYVGLDSLGFEAPVVFDNLIARREMPVTIGIGIAPGDVVSAQSPDNPRFNRSLEFDGLNDHLARFILEEVLPAVEAHKTQAGVPIRLSIDANDRAIGGGSTGGIGSFTVAWERPDAFRRVFTAIGTYVGMRGGDRYPVLVRKTEPKPIRIFMQDGSHDELDSFLGEVGDWHLSNLTMLSALEFAGYNVRHVWGEGSHNGRHATAVFPDAMRWLWLDWPLPITARPTRNVILNHALPPGTAWEAVEGAYHADGAMAATPTGDVIFGAANGQAWKIGLDGEVGDFAPRKDGISAMASGPDGALYVSDEAKAQLAVVTVTGETRVIASGLGCAALAVAANGNVYAAEAGSGPTEGRVWLIKPSGIRVLLDQGLDDPRGVALSPDGLWLAISEKHTHWGYSYAVQPDGTVLARQQFYWFHVPDDGDDSGATAWMADKEGVLYAATRMGVQLFDRNGRSRGIVPVPGGAALGLTFGGSDFTTLYIVGGDNRVYRRSLKVPGAPSWMAPVKLAKFSAG
jgi:gluconolactonase